LNIHNENLYMQKKNGLRIIRSSDLAVKLT
jgi:hypothetical protein